MPCETCGSPLPLEEFLISLFKQQAVTGYIGIQVNQIVEQDCNNLTPVAKCGSINDLSEIIKSACILDNCGNLVINVFVES